MAKIYEAMPKLFPMAPMLFPIEESMRESITARMCTWDSFTPYGLGIWGATLDTRVQAVVGTNKVFDIPAPAVAFGIGLNFEQLKVRFLETENKEGIFDQIAAEAWHFWGTGIFPSFSANDNIELQFIGPWKQAMFWGCAHIERSRK